MLCHVSDCNELVLRGTYYTARCQMLRTRSRSTALSNRDVYKYITMWTQGPAPDIVTASCSAATQQSQNQYAHTTPDA
jgi:hypothetical protein